MGEGVPVGSPSSLKVTLHSMSEICENVKYFLTHIQHTIYLINPPTMQSSIALPGVWVLVICVHEGLKKKKKLMVTFLFVLQKCQNMDENICYTQINLWTTM